MCAPPSANRKLHSSLRYFAILARNGKITSSDWHSFKDDIIAEIQCEDISLLESAFRALNSHRSCLAYSEWIQCIKDFKLLLRTHNRSQLVRLLEDGVLRQDSSEGKRPYPDSHANANSSSNFHKKIKPETPKAQTETPGRLPSLNGNSSKTGFYLLKTINVSDQQPKLGLDDIVVAGATLGVICNFKFDVKWTWQNAPALQTYQKIVIVHGEGPAEEEEWRQFLRHEASSERVRFVRPPTPPYGTVHSKAMVLCFPNTCRVCIHTANMIQVDWDYKTQGAYMRDFPLLQGGEKVDVQNIPTRKDSFKAELMRYFRHCLKPDETQSEVLKALDRYDFTSAGVELVASVPGVHRDSAKDIFGHARLRELLRKERFLEKTEPSTAVCQFSSLGSIQEKWIDQEFHRTLFSSSEPDGSDVLRGHRINRIKLVFPTVKQVFQSNEGAPAGLALPVRSKNLHRDHITRKLCKWECMTEGREMAMPHIKTYVRYPDSQPGSPCWMLLGSFNLSVAAWGRMQGARKSKLWDRLNLLSFELGVLFLPRLACNQSDRLAVTAKYPIELSTNISSREQIRRDAMRREKSLAHSSSATANSGSEGLAQLSLPYRIPPRPYGSNDVGWTVDLLL